MNTTQASSNHTTQLERKRYDSVRDRAKESILHIGVSHRVVGVTTVIVTDTGQCILCFDSCQFTWMSSNINVRCKPRLHASVDLLAPTCATLSFAIHAASHVEHK